MLLGVNIGESVVIGWGVTLFLLIVLLLINRLVIAHFRLRPKKFQLALETIVGGVYKWAEGKVGKCADFIAPVSLTLMLYVFSATIVELFGLPAATEDFNCTLAMGLCCFVAVNITAIKFHGVKGRLKNLCSPSPIVFPIRVLADLIAPVSMGIRLFANVLMGGVVMQLIYRVAPIVVPAIFSSYFTLFDLAIQTFVFGLLSLIYTGEATE